MAIADDVINLIIKGAKPAAKAAKKAGKAVKAATEGTMDLTGMKLPDAPVSAPPTIDRADVGRYVAQQRGLQVDKATKKADRLKPSGSKFFDESVPAYDRTMSIVPQTDFSGRYPQPADMSNLPLRGRMGPIIDNADAVSTELASRLMAGKGSTNQYFYRTGPMYEGMDNIGVDPQAFMGRFAPAFAGTSPRTPTDRNFLNATMMMYRDAQGLPLEKPIMGGDGINDQGYGMIVGMHPELTRKLMAGEDAFDMNTKPSSFHLNTLGNLQGETIDTHNIRGTLLSFEKLFPRQIPRGWFHNEDAYRQYLDEGLSPALLSSKTGVNDSLQNQTTKGFTSQVEYGPMADITRRAAIKAGVAPADAQALGWFGMGDQTGLASEAKTITGLANDRLDITGQILGEAPDKVAKMWGMGQIPLASVAGAGLLSLTPEEENAGKIGPRKGKKPARAK